MKRRVFNVLAAVSLVLAIATAALWVRSVWWKSDFLRFTPDTFDWEVRSMYGAIAIEREHFLSGEDHPPYWSWGDPNSTEWEPYCLLSRSRSFFTDEIESSGIEVADWLLLLVFVVLPAVWLEMRLRRRKAVGLCTKCGYDLRGTDEGRACPECGAERVVSDAKAGA